MSALEKYRAAGDKAWALIQVLVDDVIEWHRLSPSSQHERRALVRSLFAFVEGTLSAIKVFVLEVYELTGTKLSAGQVALLREEAYSLDNQGRVQTKAQFLRSSDNVRFTFSVVAEVFGDSLDVDYGASGWAAFREAVRIRNRITHPKNVADTQVSDEDVITVFLGMTWYREATKEFFRVSKNAVATFKQSPTA